MNSSRHSRPPSPQAGFSLVELLVVLIVIMILMALALPNILTARQRAEEGVAAQTLRNFHASQEAYKVSFRTYSASFLELQNIRGADIVPPGAEATVDTMILAGYIYRLVRPTPEEYTMTAEPIRNRTSRRWFRITQFGELVITIGGP